MCSLFKWVQQTVIETKKHLLLKETFSEISSVHLMDNMG